VSSEVKPVAGQWYEYTHANERVLCVAQNNKDACVIQNKDGEFEVVYGFNFDRLKHLPDCTGWDWQPETFPQYYDHGLKGDRRNGTAFIRRDSVEKYACVSVDGCDKTKYYWNESCKYYVRCGTWKQITEQQALALLDQKQTAGDWTEDAAHENGKYQNKCFTCGNVFVGHKRRVQCKVCHDKPQPAEDPEEWVVQDQVYPREGIDQYRWLPDETWQDACGTWISKHGRTYSNGERLEVRCRRKDLPAKKRTVTVPKWLCRLEEDPFEYDEVHRVGETTYEIEGE